MAKAHLKPTLLSTAVAAGLAAATMPVHALSLGISGQINKQLSSVDNGNESALAVMDNSNSGSRFRFTGEEDIGGGLKVGGVWEWQWQNTPSSGSEFNAAGQIEETSATGLQDRKTELYFAAKWGKVSLGKGDGAGNGAAASTSRPPPTFPGLAPGLLSALWRAPSTCSAATTASATTPRSSPSG
jgi:predicted porin